MAPVLHEQETATFQYLNISEIVERNRVSHTIRAEDREKVRHHRFAPTVVRLDAGNPDQRETISFIYFMQTFITIRTLIHTSINSFWESGQGFMDEVF